MYRRSPVAIRAELSEQEIDIQALGIPIADPLPSLKSMWSVC
jgi:hypothetical protein